MTVNSDTEMVLAAEGKSSIGDDNCRPVYGTGSDVLLSAISRFRNFTGWKAVRERFFYGHLRGGDQLFSATSYFYPRRRRHQCINHVLDSSRVRRDSWILASGTNYLPVLKIRLMSYMSS
jgi:hypothetical protein